MKKYFTISLFAFALLFCKQQIHAQNGEQLFKAKCNVCHIVDKNSTGPLLKGVFKKWSDAGEAEMLYEWVKNPENLITSGTSQLANAIKNYSASAMTAQVVTNAEVDAILAYVDNYTAAIAPVADTVGASNLAAKKIVPNYIENLTLFYWLSFTIILLLIAIVILSTTVSTFIKSDFFKNKLAEKSQNNSTTLLVVLISFGTILLSSPSYALTFMQPGEAEKDMPWLLVETSDIYLMLAVNFILLGVLLYVRRMFKDFLEMVKTPKAIQVVAANSTTRKMTKILTDVVPIEEEYTILMHHDYDGIQELDNNLPPWWVWGFYATIIFAVVYIFNYHVLKTADLQIKEYDKEIAQSKIDITAYLNKMAMNVDETNATQLTDAKDLSSGKTIFETNCVLCHNAKGEGNIGPNLTDNYWIYGPDVRNIFKIIKFGTANGMPEHASKINPIQIQQVASYVLSLVNAEGREPQGIEYNKDGLAIQ